MPRGHKSTSLPATAAEQTEEGGTAYSSPPTLFISPGCAAIWQPVSRMDTLVYHEGLDLKSIYL